MLQPMKREHKGLLLIVGIAMVVVYLLYYAAIVAGSE